MDAAEILALLREDQMRRQAEQAVAHARKIVAKVLQKEIDDAWKGVFECCKSGDESPGTTPDLSAFLGLGNLLKKKAWDVHLHPMSETLSQALEDPLDFRPGQLFIVTLLLIACESRPSKQKLRKAYNEFRPEIAPHFWRAESAAYVRDFLDTRIDLAFIDKKKQAEEEAAAAIVRRNEQLVTAARKRPAIEKQLFAVYWYEQGFGPAEIRDKWNGLQGLDGVGSGRRGRTDISAAIRRGKEFFSGLGTTATELASLLRFSLES